ncbi:MAG: PDDEXK family nuclease [Candidatus Dormibacteria bacterium]
MQADAGRVLGWAGGGGALVAVLSDRRTRPPLHRLFGQKGYRAEGLVKQAPSGLLVRSDAEVLIAEELTKAGVKFSYERRIRGGDGSWRLPDFTIYGPGGRAWYIEYLGMLDDAGYRSRVRVNQKWYERWKGGRVIFLTGSGGILRRRLQAMISDLRPLGLALRDRRAS